MPVENVRLVVPPLMPLTFSSTVPFFLRVGGLFLLFFVHDPLFQAFAELPSFYPPLFSLGTESSIAGLVFFHFVSGRSRYGCLGLSSFFLVHFFLLFCVEPALSPFKFVL